MKYGPLTREDKKPIETENDVAPSVPSAENAPQYKCQPVLNYHTSKVYDDKYDRV